MSVIYSLKRRWGKRVTIYSITDSILNLDTGKKVLTKASKIINKAVFLPPKQVREIIKKQAAFDPRATIVLIDKNDVRDFPIKLDDYITYNNWRFIIVEINDHDDFYALKVHAVGRIIEPLTANNNLILNQVPKCEKYRKRFANNTLVFNEDILCFICKDLLVNNTLVFNEDTGRLIIRSPIIEDTLVFSDECECMWPKFCTSIDSIVFNEIIERAITRSLIIEDTLVLNQSINRSIIGNLTITDSLSFSDEALSEFVATLFTNLEASWKLDETSGIRYDNYGSRDLTDINTVGYATGKLGNAARFTKADNDYLWTASGFDPGNSNFTIAGWFKFRVAENVYYFAEKNDTTGTTYYIERDNGSGKLYWGVIGPGDSSSVPHTTVPVINVWYWVCMWHDGDNNLIGIRINDGSDITTPHSVGINSGNSPYFMLGTYHKNTGYSNIDIDAFQYWSRLLSSDEKDQVYNSGTGVEL